MIPKIKISYADNFFADEYLDNVISCKIEVGYYIPADIAYIVSRIDSMPEKIKEVSIEYMGKTLFRGIVDIQQTRFDENGGNFYIVARSLEALFIDCEAKPTSFQYPTTKTIQQNYLNKFNIGCYDNNLKGAIPVFTVSDATTEWDVIKRFFDESYGFTPYIDHDRVLKIRNNNNRPTYKISNTILDDSTRKYISAQIKTNSSNIISHVYIINSETGITDVTITDNQCEQNGIYRARYRECDPEDIESMFKKYAAIIKNQYVKETVYTFELDNAFDIALGDKIDFNEPEHCMSITLRVTEKHFSFDQNGIKQTICCINDEYFK